MISTTKPTVLQRMASISARVAALKSRKTALDDEIAEEQTRPLPCTVRLRRLKARKLYIRDQLARYDGLLRTLKPLAGHAVARERGMA